MQLSEEQRWQVPRMQASYRPVTLKFELLHPTSRYILLSMNNIECKSYLDMSTNKVNFSFDLNPLIQVPIYLVVFRICYSFTPQDLNSYKSIESVLNLHEIGSQ